MTDKLKNAMTELAGQDAAISVKGKLYTQVKDRVVVWRNHFGVEHGIESEVVSDDGTTVMVRCLIRDSAGMIIGSGLAEEIRGSGNVNKTAALENAETSALGRALASLGLHGGEYASINEMDKTTREPPPQKTVQSIEDTLEIEPPSWVDEAIAGFAKHRHMGEHAAWASDNKETLQGLDDDEYHRLIAAWRARQLALTNGETRNV